jgi:glycine/D-amino acid oxidase-like deaminating enzyme
MPATLEADAPGCLYAATAPPSAPAPPLAAAVRADVVVVGAGFTGLSAALHLAERGRSVVVLEAREPGWGAAGRNGGQVNAGLKHEPDQVERDLGPVHGPRLVRLAGDAPEYLFALIERLGIACEARREGTIRAACRSRHVAALAASAEQWRRRGVAVELWDAARVAAATGTDRYLAATFDPRGGSLQPLALTRGLAAAAIAAGASLHADSRVQRLERADGAWSVATAGGSVRAGAVVIATDGYSDDLWPGLRTSIIPVYSSIVASEPLPAAIARAVLPRGGVLYESGDITIYYRRDAHDRLLMGGRGPQRSATARADYQHLTSYARRLWPALGELAWTHYWNGQFALTPDFYPRFHAPAEGLYIALGYSGRGVALGVAAGTQLAAAATGAALESLAIPPTPIPRIPFHALWKVGVGARVAWGRLRDRAGR